MQRLRLRFCRGEEIKFISHLDMMRLWQRALTRAEIPLAYSEGFNPHPRISLVAPLAMGVTSDAELMDISCTRWVSPLWFTQAVKRQLPPGIEILQVYPIAPSQPSLQSQVRHAEYRVEVETEKEPKDIEAKLGSLLSAEQLPWQHQRDTGIRSYDLRALIDDLWLIDCYPPYCTIGMRLRCDNSGSGRPEQVVAALGFAAYPRSVHRTKLILEAV
jgi:radical SAM-linked protein